MTEDLKSLSTSATGHRDFISNAGASNVDKQGAQTSFGLGDLALLADASKLKEGETSTLREDSLQLRKRIMDVQSLMLQGTITTLSFSERPLTRPTLTLCAADTKAEEAARYVAARQDPKMLEVRFTLSHLDTRGGV